MSRDLQRRMRPLLGTFVEVGVQFADDAACAIEAAFHEIEAIHSLMSFQDPASELSRLNRSSGEWINLSHATLRVLRLATALGKKTNERFNCTVGGALIEKGLLPTHGGNFIAWGSSSDIQLATSHARLHRPVRVVLDGIAKGFAIDMAVRVLRRHGVRSGWINAGGDARAFGETQLALHRRDERGNTRFVGYLRNAAIATSNTFANSAHDTFGQIVSTNAKELRPEVISVVSSSAWRADALTKVAASLRRDDRERVLLSLGGRWVDAVSEKRAA